MTSHREGGATTAPDTRDSIIELVERHGWHEPTSYDRSMGLYCHCGKYCPAGMQEWRKHVVKVLTRFNFLHLLSNAWDHGFEAGLAADQTKWEKNPYREDA